MNALSTEQVDLANWVREQIREGCARCVLRQRVHDIEQLVREWALDPATDPDALAEEILIKASDESRQLRGPTLFGIFAHRLGATGHFDRKLFRVDGTGGESGILEETESADASGVVAQMLRHTELSARIALTQALEVVEHYKGVVQRQSARIAELEAKTNSGGPRASSRRKKPATPGRRAARRDH